MTDGNPDSYEKFMSDLGITCEDLRRKIIPDHVIDSEYFSFNKETGNLVVPQEYLPRQVELFKKYVMDKKSSGLGDDVLQPLLFDAAFKGHDRVQYNGLHQAISSNKDDIAIKLVGQAEARQLCLGTPPDITFAILHDKTQIADAIIAKEGIKPEQLLRHYVYPQNPAKSSNSLRDALEKEKNGNDAYIKAVNGNIADKLMAVATPELLTKLYRDGKKILDITIENGDERRSITIFNKCSDKLTDKEKIKYWNMAKSYVSNGSYQMPELVDAIEKKLDRSFVRSLQIISPEIYPTNTRSSDGRPR